MAEKKVRDMNGKIIKVNDIILIHNYFASCGDDDCSFCEKKKQDAIGNLGIVSGFGCVQVDIPDFSIDSEPESVETIICDEKYLEVVGDVRCKKSS